MGYDIYGNELKRGHCEVHPHVAEEYPCSLCCNQKNNLLLDEASMMFNILEDIKSKSFSDNKGNYICHIPRELMDMINGIIGDNKNDI